MTPPPPTPSARDAEAIDALFAVIKKADGRADDAHNTQGDLWMIEAILKTLRSLGWRAPYDEVTDKMVDAAWESHLEGLQPEVIGLMFKKNQLRFAIQAAIGAGT